MIKILILDDGEHCNRSLLHEAIETGDTQKVKALLQEEIDLHKTGNWGCTPLEYAIELGCLEIAKILINAGADIHFGVEGFLLNIAVRHSRLDIASILIDAGANINLKDEDNATVLMDAVLDNSLEIVEFLVRQGADVNVVRKDGNSALSCAATLGQEEIFNYLAPLTSKNLFEQAVEKLPEGLLYRKRVDDRFTEDFILAAGEGRVDTIKEAIRLGVDINAISAEGNTALCFASYWGQLDVVKMLLENGADLEMRSEQTGLTPLLEAAHFGQFKIVKFLTESGADLNAKDRNGKTALMIAVDRATYPRKIVSRLLLQKYTKYLEVIQFLLKNEIDINVKDNAGNTALKIARSKDKSEIVQLLLDAGAT